MPITPEERDRLIQRWMETMRSYYRSDAKRVYYLSMEFLTGRLLSNSLLNMGFHEECRKALLDLALLSFCRKENHRYILQVWICFHDLTGFITGHTRHANIHEDEIGVHFWREFHSLLAIACREYFMTCKSQCESDQVPNITFVFCNQDLCHSILIVFRIQAE